MNDTATLLDSLDQRCDDDPAICGSVVSRMRSHDDDESLPQYRVSVIATRGDITETADTLAAAVTAALGRIERGDWKW
ncbi:hypothetical protein SEA_JUJU_55 [Gordonia phage JuJu]|uniref:Uncharacterized protein n=1 Tax=Gordonia phage JuJu TaxID=2590929 RepID=A0A516KR54_9CAUD|nr:hypothetical protein KNU69_gp55 [Gordonia phage JuJu]QDP44171.1 hypothetical protein SEA_JUJU_55 [Gordonia phage JuJu]